MPYFYDHRSTYQLSSQLSPLLAVDSNAKVHTDNGWQVTDFGILLTKGSVCITALPQVFWTPVEEEAGRARVADGRGI